MINTKKINISIQNELIELEEGTYNILIIGGWRVKLNSFLITLRNIETGKIIYPRNTIWKYQTYLFKKRAKRIRILDIKEYGTYEIKFKNSESVLLKKSNLFLSSFFQKPVSVSEIEIVIK
ncbi:hypothetical protein [Patiriisocius hiemis]|uniref:Uncharacterized protein n=1 Tax=Patiriisocius hiemis TaxID=3075604 RepID=A0ABU2YAA7_9FLAO|nr:hypothetical protein [Constantimarinum sp. W242]MDT0555123.1 hypothetical protein [Constantimarinum sp. W242]